jgi:hypothetical protein
VAGTFDKLPAIVVLDSLEKGWSLGIDQSRRNRCQQMVQRRLVGLVTGLTPLCLIKGKPYS